jgi:hypothetical protein
MVSRVAPEQGEGQPFWLTSFRDSEASINLLVNAFCQIHWGKDRERSAVLASVMAILADVFASITGRN